MPEICTPLCNLYSVPVPVSTYMRVPHVLRRVKIGLFYIRNSIKSLLLFQDDNEINLCILQSKKAIRRTQKWKQS